ncbi:MAG: Type restriction-modification system, specificity subunit [Conexibacter sp.]|nr:Type restriction-modification system, specificity subunit [Conexibacter sp.]
MSGHGDTPPSLPDRWAEATFGDLCMPVEKTDPRTRPQESFVYIDISAIDREKLRVVDEKRLSGTEAPSRARQVVRTGDILMSTVRPNLRTMAQVPSELDGAVASTGFCVLRAHPDISADFLFAALCSDEAQNEILAKARGVSYPAVRDVDVFSQRLLVPPAVEQRRLVADLTEQLAAIDAGAAEIALAELKLGHFQRGVLDSLDDGSTLRPISELATVYVGATPDRKQPAYWGGDVAWVSSGEIAWERIASTRETITEAALGTSRARRVHPPGTVLLGMIGEGKTRGQAAILDVEAAHNQNSAAIRLSPDQMRPEFLFLWFMRQYAETRSLGSGTQQAALNGKLVAAMKVPCPSLADQDEMIAAAREGLDALRRLRGEIADQIVFAERLRASLLHSVLSGQVTAGEPADEPANVLLARVAAERERKAASRPAKRGRSTKAKSAQSALELSGSTTSHESAR